MPVDASIYSQVGRQNVQPLNPLEAMANAYQLQNAQIDSDNKRQLMMDDRAMREAARMSGGDGTKLYQLLMQGGNIGAADKVRKSNLEYDKGAAEIASRKIADQKSTEEFLDKALERTRSFANQVNSPESAAAYLNGLYSHPQLGKIASSMMPLEQAMKNIPQNFNSPDGLRWKAAHVNITGKDLMGLLTPKLDSERLGGNMSFGSRDQFSGLRTEQGTAPITQSADSIASQETQRRGQNMVDARSREANQASREASQSVYDTERGLLINKSTGLARPAATFDGKPVGSKDKPLTDAQSKAALFGTRMQESNKVLEQLATKGTEATTMPGMNTGYGIGTVSNALASGEQQQLMQAKRDFVNAVLRRESGAVIADSEFANAEKQYFPQIGDSAQTKAQKKRNREIAIRGVQAEIPRASRGVVDEIAGNPAGIDSLLEKYK